MAYDEDLADRIRQDGPLPFPVFMEAALYDDRAGFYAAGGRAGGRSGDFVTSPEVGPLFGAVLARALDTWWAELGRPRPFVLVDAGAGPGTLARAVLAARPDVLAAGALRYFAVERSLPQRAHHIDLPVESVTNRPQGSLVGVVVANELLDNLPFRLAVFDGGWREAYVDLGSDGRFVELLRAFDAVPACLPVVAPHGARAPVQEEAAEWVEDTVSSLQQGRLIALDQLPAPTQVQTQTEFLRVHGLDELVEEGRRVWATKAAAPDLAALAARSRIREAEALTDPSGLGAFTVAEWVIE